MRFLFTLSIFIASAMIAYTPERQLVFDHFGLESGFISREAMSIVSPPDGMIWVSSNDGIARFDGKRVKFFQHQPGNTHSLTHNYCTGLKADRYGRLWIQADNDLDIFNPATELVSHVRFPGKKSVFPTALTYDEKRDIMYIGTRHGLFSSDSSSSGIVPLQGFRGDSSMEHSNVFLQHLQIVFIS